MRGISLSHVGNPICCNDSILREAADWRLRKIPVRALYPLCALLLSFVLPLASASDQALWEHSTLNQILKRGELRVGVEARSEEHTSELQSLMRISYAVFCLKKKK